MAFGDFSRSGKPHLGSRKEGGEKLGQEYGPTTIHSCHIIFGRLNWKISEFPFKSKILSQPHHLMIIWDHIIMII